MTDTAAGRLLPFSLPTDRTDVSDVRFRVPGTGENQIRIGIRRDVAEVWYASRLRGSFDRGVLRDWLAHPRDWLERDEVLWLGTPTYVAIGIAGLLEVGVIPPGAVDQLLEGV